MSTDRPHRHVALAVEPHAHGEGDEHRWSMRHGILVMHDHRRRSRLERAEHQKEMRDRAVRAALRHAVRDTSEPWPVSRFGNERDRYRLVSTLDQIAHAEGVVYERTVDDTMPGWLYVRAWRRREDPR